MTRGKLVFKHKGIYYVSNEFNGDCGDNMEVGEYILKTFGRVSSIDEYEKYVQYISDKFYDSIDIYIDICNDFNEKVLNTDYSYVKESNKEYIEILFYGKKRSDW